MLYQAICTVNYNGKKYKPGEKVELPDAVAERFLDLATVRLVSNENDSANKLHSNK